MAMIVSQTGQWNRLIVVLLILGVGALVAIFAALVNGS
jgi:hypothetical protein